MSTPPGTASDPIFTDAPPLSAGVAFVIGVAGAALVLAQTVLRAWRRVSLSQARGLLLARVHLLLVVLAAVAAASLLGSLRFFPDDSRPLGGLLPLLGVLAPFVFLARRPDATTSSVTRPTRTRLLDWLIQSPVNLVLLLPGLALSGLCVWGMVVAEAWDVLALAFSASVAVLTRADPVVYRAWDGVGARWQWGRVLPSPVRNPAWRFVVGRVEEPGGVVGVEVDAMEVPAADTVLLQGALFGETAHLSDRALAKSMATRGVLGTMPLFYEYVDQVWSHIIPDASRGGVKEGQKIDETAASCFLLIASLLREALDDNARLGADVWLLLAIFRHRINEIAANYVSASNLRHSPLHSRIAMSMRELWSSFAGRSRELQSLRDDSTAEEDITGPETDGSVVVEVDTSKEANEEGDNATGTARKQGEENGDENDTGDEIEEHDGDDLLSTNIPDGALTGGRKLAMWHALDATENPPEVVDTEIWASWIITCLQDLYDAALKTLEAAPDKVNREQATNMPATFKLWLGEPLVLALQGELVEGMSSAALQATDSLSQPLSRHERKGESENGKKESVLDEATELVAEEETFTYIMLALAGVEVSETAHFGEGVDGTGFIGIGGNVSQGELNGRLKAQNMAYKIMMVQNALWGYVALGQTASALLARS